MHITTVGIDVTKNIFQLHGVGARGRAVLSKLPIAMGMSF
jgi:hypothetical protein